MVLAIKNMTVCYNLTLIFLSTSINLEKRRNKEEREVWKSTEPEPVVSTLPR
jgi:hypothetical protein